MPKRTVSDDDQPRTPYRRATTPEGRENQLVALAYDLAEQQLRAGTASSQVIAQLMKQGSPRERLERDRLARENDLLRAKVEQLESMQRTEELYQQALDAMRSYSGQGPVVSDLEYDDDD